MPPALNHHPLSKYYRFQSQCYDLTRWSFLFGRRLLIRSLPFHPKTRFRVLEVGCGTGKNLTAIARRFPHAQITGIDLSEDMLSICRKKLTPYNGRVTTVHGAFGEVKLRENFDLIIFSYCLTMVNPGGGRLIRLAAASLVPNGVIAAVDFHDSPLTSFQRHMHGHHVRLEAQLLPEFKDIFQTKEATVHKAYLGVWQWFSFIGERRNTY